MASESSAGFHHQQQGILFKSGGATSSSSSGSGGGEFMSAGNYNYVHGGGSLNLSGPRGGMLFSSRNSMDSCLTSVPGLKHNTGFAVEWSMEEQYKLEEGLTKYADEPNIARYVKIAASLRDKTVRDVALRCRWTMRKRRKQGHQQSLEKKVKDQKIFSALDIYGSGQSLEKDVLLDVFTGVLSGTARHLLEENNQAFEQISANLSTLKLQQNIDLFCRSRNNLIAILNGMRNMPGIMSQMPPLPVHFNEELASSIFPPSSQPMMFSSSSTTSVKQEPGC